MRQITVIRIFWLAVVFLGTTFSSYGQITAETIEKNSLEAIKILENLVNSYHKDQAQGEKFIKEAYSKGSQNIFIEGSKFQNFLPHEFIKQQTTPFEIKDVKIGTALKNANDHSVPVNFSIRNVDYDAKLIVKNDGTTHLFDIHTRKVYERPIAGQPLSLPSTNTFALPDEQPTVLPPIRTPKTAERNSNNYPLENCQATRDSLLDLQAKYQKIRSDKNRLARQKKALVKDTLRLYKHLENTQSALKLSRDSIRVLQTTLVIREDSIRQLRQRETELRRILSIRNDTILILRNRIARLQDTLQVRETTIRALRDLLAQKEALILAQKDTIGKREQKIERMSNALDEYADRHFRTPVVGFTTSLINSPSFPGCDPFSTRFKCNSGIEMGVFFLYKRGGFFVFKNGRSSKMETPDVFYSSEYIAEVKAQLQDQGESYTDLQYEGSYSDYQGWKFGAYFMFHKKVPLYGQVGYGLHKGEVLDLYTGDLNGRLLANADGKVAINQLNISEKGAFLVGLLYAPKIGYSPKKSIRQQKPWPLTPVLEAGFDFKLKEPYINIGIGLPLWGVYKKTSLKAE